MGARRSVAGNPKQTALALVDTLPAEYRHVVDQLGIEPAEVSFDSQPASSGSQLTLIYSIVLPVALADPDAPGAEGWIPLVESGGSQTQARRRGSDLLRNEPYGKRLAEYWREELEEETRLFAFLPRYFTGRQARDVYSAFWGYEQDPDGFATWSGIGQNKEGVYSDHIEDQDLGEGDLLPAQVHAVLKADSANTLGGSDAAATLLCESASNGAVGLWPRSRAVGSATETALMPLLAAASLVAYQRTSRGPKPNWYKRKAAKPCVERLERLYAPRAVWVFPPHDSKKTQRKPT